jgi:tetratricopeptide (TPR) repeat protein
VCFEAEEEALRRWPRGTPGRFHVLVSRGMTLQQLEREAEGLAALDEAVEACGDRPDLVADAIFWRGVFHTNGRRWAESLADFELATATLERSGGTPPNGWWHYHRAQCLLRLGRADEALKMVEGARAFGEPPAADLDRLEAEIRAAR